MNRRGWRLVLVIGISAAVLSVGPTAAAAPAACLALQVQSNGRGLSTLVAVDLPGGRVRTIAELGFKVNAIGTAGDTVYGLATRGRSGPFPDGGHVVTIARDGTTVDKGPLRGWPHPLQALAGTVSGTRWYLRDDTGLYVVDVDPRSARYLTVVSHVWLWPGGLARSVDDFDFGPDGLLYGVAAHGKLVTLDPRTGEVRPTRSPSVGQGTSYGAAARASDGTLYVLANDYRGHSVWFHVTLRPPAVAELVSKPTVDHTDAAGCLPAPPPPPPPPTVPVPVPPTTTPPRTTTAAPIPAPPPATTTRPPTTTTQPPTTSPTTPPPTTTAPTSPTPPPTPAPNPPAPTRKPYRTATPTAPAPKDYQTRTEEKRRWGLTALVLILGGGAAASAARRRR
ncbi:putative secreted protein [Alloactinosynnema sp. L-07]|uniref:DUF6923 family protein n=1 Tax=Alloactinosynnema sp. L-07 TaxID=1653480 RepID=UPI00065EF4FC|nr:PQQ-binding-like beta-propeller repeat protein [Alloactinosynnema sp. L-07]CRK56067.1 putative secreted protein [Alloactinosynnema sp. L-07]